MFLIAIFRPFLIAIGTIQSRHPGEGRYHMHTCLGQLRRSPIHLAPRQRGEGGAQRVSVGRVRGTRSLSAALRRTKGSLVKVPAVRLRGAAKKEVTGTPLTLPLLRNGPLPCMRLFLSRL